VGVVEPPALRRAVAFIDAHADQDIGMAQIAEAAGIRGCRGGCCHLVPSGSECVISPCGGRVVLHGELVDDVVVAGLGVGEGEAAVDLQAGAGGVAGVGLDVGVVDAVGFEPGEQEVSEPVGWHVVV
jgi:hypothetical protein